MGLFRVSHEWRRRGGSGAKRPLLPKICHTYPTIMKLGTVIPYLKIGTRYDFEILHQHGIRVKIKIQKVFRAKSYACRS